LLKASLYFYLLLSLIGGDGFGSAISELLQWCLKMMLSHVSDVRQMLFGISNKALGSPIYTDKFTLFSNIKISIREENRK